MTDDEFKQRVIMLLEIIAFGEESKGCQHEKAIDIGVMGDRLGEHMLCPECNEKFSRIVEEVTDHG